jgi:hypothetical protein
MVGGAAWLLDVGRAEPADPQQPLGHSLRRRTARLSVEPLSEGPLDGLGKALSGSLRQLPGERIGFVILDAESHGNLS